MPQSPVEKLLYLALLFLFIINIIGIGINLNTNHNLNKRTMDIQNQISCIGAYFNQTDRANLIIPNLQSCNIQKAP